MMANSETKILGCVKVQSLWVFGSSTNCREIHDSGIGQLISIRAAAIAACISEYDDMTNYLNHVINEDREKKGRQSS